MLTLTEEQITENWDTFLQNFVDCTEPKSERQKLLFKFYQARETEFATIPASSSIYHHSACVGGYVKHVNRVYEACKQIYSVWEGFDGVGGFTLNELLFAAIHHDLGKVGDMDEILYQQVEEQWKIDKGTLYEYNPKISYMTIPDRSIYLLNQIGIKLTENEYITIKTHDGLYEEANKAYLMSYAAPRLRNNMSHILHQADMLAARTEYEEFMNSKKADPEKPVDSTIKKILNLV